MVDVCWSTASLGWTGRLRTRRRPKGSHDSARTAGSPATTSLAILVCTTGHHTPITAHDRPRQKSRNGSWPPRRDRGSDRCRTGCAQRTVSRLLWRHRLPYLREWDTLTGEVIRASMTTAGRYEHDRPGEVVHGDVKKIGTIPDGRRRKAHGRATTAKRKTRVGYDLRPFHGR